MKEEYFADDRVVIPEYIKKMTSEERMAEIEKLEKEAKERKERKARSQKLAATVY